MFMRLIIIDHYVDVPEILFGFLVHQQSAASNDITLFVSFTLLMMNYDPTIRDLFKQKWPKVWNK